LEKRFRERFYSSVQKDIKRRSKGKPSHTTTLKSIKENKERLEQVRKLRYALLGEELNLTTESKVKSPQIAHHFS
jgi:DNA-binding IclR family transcriptional regulator